MQTVTLGSLTVGNWAQVAAASRAIQAGSFGAPKSYTRFDANARLEALVVHHLMNTSRDTLGREIQAGQAAVGNDNFFARAVARVKASRGKNPAFRNGSSTRSRW